MSLSNLLLSIVVGSAIVMFADLIVLLVRSYWPVILFSEFSSFHVGKDLKPRTGSWRVYQILATINLAVWIGILILFWLGLSSWNNLSIVFLVFSLAVIQFAYLNLYHLPQKKSSTQPWRIREKSNRSSNPFFSDTI